MIVELIALLMMVGTGSGVLVTFLLWHRLGLRALHRFVRGLSRQDAFELLSVEVEDSVTPAHAVLLDGRRHVDVSVTQHGLRDLWRVRVDVRGTVPPFQLAEGRYAASFVGLSGRESSAFQARSGLHYRLFSDEVARVREHLDTPSWRSALASILDAPVHLRRCSVGAEAIELDFDRRGLRVDELLAALNAGCQLADAVENLAPQRRMLPAARAPLRIVDHALSGLPLGVPVPRR